VFQGSVRLGDTALENIKETLLLKTWKFISFSLPNINMNGKFYIHGSVYRELN